MIKLNKSGLITFTGICMSSHDKGGQKQGIITPWTQLHARNKDQRERERRGQPSWALQKLLKTHIIVKCWQSLEQFPFPGLCICVYRILNMGQGLKRTLSQMQKERAAHPFGNGILTLLDFKCPNSRSILLDFVPIL